MSKISELSDGGSLVSSDYLIAVRSGGNVKVRMDQINVDQVDLGDNEFIRLGNSQDLTMVHTSTQSIINQAGIGDLLLQKAGTTKASITANGLEFPDNSKAIFGAGSDLQIYHDGSNSYIKDTTTGNLNITGNDIQILNAAADEAMAYFAQDGGVTLYHNGSAKLATTASGIDVTGSVTATGIIEASDGTNGEMQFGLGTALTTGAGTYDSSVRWNGSAGNLLFSQGAVEKMRITSTGIDVTGSVTANGLTVETSADPALITLRHTGNTSGFLIRNFSGGEAQLVNVDNGPMVFKTNDTERLRIDSVGVLQSNGYSVVASAARPASGTLRLGNLPSTSMLLDYDDQGQTIATVRNQYGSTADAAELSLDSGFITFNTGTSFTEAMRIDASGDTFFGISSKADVPTNGGVYIAGDNSVGSSNSYAQVFVVHNSNTNHGIILKELNATGQAIQFLNSSATLVGSISTDASATAYNTSSDQRLKDNIVDAPSASDDIDAIQVRSFDWKADGSHQKYGMVAQELQSVAPEAVTGDADSDDMMGVDYSKLVPMMLKEIQSLRARVAQLES